METSEGPAEARVESLRAFPTGDNIPALLALHLEIDRIELCHLPAEEPAFPSPEMHLMKIRIHVHGAAQERRRRGGRLPGSLKLRGIEGGEGKML
jgi:hypothetical protein